MALYFGIYYFNFMLQLCGFFYLKINVEISIKTSTKIQMYGITEQGKILLKKFKLLSYDGN